MRSGLHELWTCEIYCLPEANRLKDLEFSEENLIMATLGGVAQTNASSAADKLALDPVGLSRYHSGANSVLCVGIVTGLLFGSLGWLPAWGGFLLGALPAFFMIALAHTLCDEQ
jgi:hypothetical protein